MTLAPQQQVISAQVWVCDACGAQDHKSCGCNSSAHMEALLDKRERNRQANRALRERKAEQNQAARDHHAIIDFPSKFQPDAQVQRIHVEVEPESVPACTLVSVKVNEQFEKAYYDQARWLLETMAETTRQKLFRHITSKYGVPIVSPSASVENE